MSKKVYSGAACTCTDCGRALWLEDGPTCPECLAKRERIATEGATEDDMAEFEQKLAKAMGAVIVVPAFKSQERKS